MPDKSLPSNVALKLGGIALLAGTFDITDAIVSSHFHGIAPTAIFRYIASGFLGMKSLTMGPPAIALGVLSHYAIAFIWTVLFYAASRKLLVLTRRPVICGLLYGVLVYLLMNWVVVPLSRVPHIAKPATIAAKINGVLAVMFCIGLTISLLVSKKLKPSSP